MSYWKRDTVDPKIEKIIRRVRDTQRADSNRVHTNKNSQRLAASRRKGMTAKECFEAWLNQKHDRIAALAAALSPTFAPRLNKRSLEVASKNRRSLLASSRLRPQAARSPRSPPGAPAAVHRLAESQLLVSAEPPGPARSANIYRSITMSYLSTAGP